jgi:FkbM family methyltransferase
LVEFGLRHAPESLLVLAARRAAPTALLTLSPGWSFAAATEATGRRVQTRRELWTAFRMRGIRRPVTIEWYEGLRLRLFLGNDLSLCVYVLGSFEPNELSLLSRVLQPGMVFVDGGANDGLYSLVASRRVGSAGRVVAVEPSSREFERLAANIRLNGIKNTIQVRAALGGAAGTVTLAIAPEGHAGQNTVGTELANPNIEPAAHESVALTTLDDLVSDHRLGRVDVIKLDVEGSEVLALAGARRVLERDRPLLLVEAEEERLASHGRRKEELVDALVGLGYRLHVFDGTTGQLRPPALPGEPEGTLVAAQPDWRPPVL